MSVRIFYNKYMLQDDNITKEYLDLALDKRFEEFARMIANGFAEAKKDLYEAEVRLYDRFASIDTTAQKIEGHIGRMEVRFGYLDEIVLKDHRVRIAALEKEVF